MHSKNIQRNNNAEICKTMVLGMIWDHLILGESTTTPSQMVNTIIIPDLNLFNLRYKFVTHHIRMVQRMCSEQSSWVSLCNASIPTPTNALQTKFQPRRKYIFLTQN